MTQIAILSGKGGTGKTSLAAAFARLAAPVVTADADVDAANLALLMPGDDEPARQFRAGHVVTMDLQSCTACLACLDACRFDAIRLVSGMPRIDEVACAGCGGCALVCPVDAISLREDVVGDWTVRRTASGPLVHAALRVGRDNSGKLVSLVREEARRAATRAGIDLVLVDGPPGLGCPVHAALTGVDLAVVVAEPTAAGLHDLGRLLLLSSRFQAPAAVLLNKADLHPGGAAAIEAHCAERHVPLVGRIPFCEEVPRALAAGRTPLEVPAVAPAVREAWSAVKQLVGTRAAPRVLPLASSEP